MAKVNKENMDFSMNTQESITNKWFKVTEGVNGPFLCGFRVANPTLSKKTKGLSADDQAARLLEVVLDKKAGFQVVLTYSTEEKYLTYQFSTPKGILYLSLNYFPTKVPEEAMKLLEGAALDVTLSSKEELNLLRNGSTAQTDNAMADLAAKFVI